MEQHTYILKIQSIETSHDLEAYRVHLLGKSGEITQQMKALGQLEGEARRQQGATLNALKEAVSEALKEQAAKIYDAELAVRLGQEWIDVSLPPRPYHEGTLHPVMQALEEAVAIFGNMGFDWAEGPEIEDDYHNFTALNIPESHPTRQLMDTFYLPGEREGRPLVLRTHTTGLQVRTLKAFKPPLRMIAPGRVYRSDYDQTHTPNFHQIDGVVVDENVHMGHLKGCLEAFCEAFFQVSPLPMRFRPSFFPFTEPSAEVDIRCERAKEKIKIGQGDDWLEILGCGMIHPKVLENCGIDPNQYQGFAFGMGIERIAMLKYGIPDIRAFYGADMRWLGHYGFSGLDAPPLAPVPRFQFCHQS